MTRRVRPSRSARLPVPTGGRVRAFTLIEILLAIGLLVAVLSIVGPAIFERLAPRTFDETVERFASELRLAREDARRTGEVTLVYATRNPEDGTIRIETRRNPITSEDGGRAAPGATAFAPAGFGSVGPVTGGFGADANRGAVAGRDAAETWSVPVGEERPRLLFELPDGYDLVHTRPAFLVPDDGFGTTLDDEALNEIGGIAPEDGSPEEGFAGGAFPDDMLAGFADSEPVLLAVCVPDGTVLAARPTWITDPDQRAARLRIEPASGLIRFERERIPTAGGERLDGFGDEAFMPEMPGRSSGPQGSVRERPAAPGGGRP
jgi:type II secretory pathway pseudopilin PulG